MVKDEAESTVAFEAIVAHLSEQYEAVSAGKMFGKRCIKIRGKAFAVLFSDDLAVKLTEANLANALQLENAELWDPSGKNRPMKEWVQIPAQFVDEWEQYAEAALNYVREIDKK